MKAEKQREEATRDGAMYLKFSMATNLGKVLPWAGDLLQYGTSGGGKRKEFRYEKTQQYTVNTTVRNSTLTEIGPVG